MHIIHELPHLPYDVALIGSSGLKETTGPVCAAAGVIIGIVLNRGIHPV